MHQVYLTGRKMHNCESENVFLRNRNATSQYQNISSCSKNVVWFFSLTRSFSVFFLWRLFLLRLTLVGWKKCPIGGSQTLKLFDKNFRNFFNKANSVCDAYSYHRPSGLSPARGSYVGGYPVTPKHGHGAYDSCIALQLSSQYLQLPMIGGWIFTISIHSSLDFDLEIGLNNLT